MKGAPHGPAIVWFRNDLRLKDHPALLAACERGGPVIPVFVCSPGEEDWAPGAASRWWLHHSLSAFDRALRALSSRLTIRAGPALPALQSLCSEAGAEAVYWSKRYEPSVAARDAAAAETLRGQGIEVKSFPGCLLYEPGSVLTKSDKPYQVFTPFWKACRVRSEPPRPLPSPKRIKAPRQWPESFALRELGLPPKPDWASGFRRVWEPGLGGAAAALNEFASGAVTSYGEGRDRPGQKGTSRLSPHLHFGEVSPRQVWHAVRQGSKSRALDSRSKTEADVFLRQLGWREFAHHLLFQFPQTVDEPLRVEFARFPWKTDARSLRAWQRGRTGYPIVDAGMRELWTTGWMHNRVRMIVASFLVKDLLIPWQQGAEWFWDTLVDADLANNTLGWQWAAGCGADAAPFFRILNPTLQGRKFDPEGGYVRRWVPELRGLPSRWIHEPWNAPGSVLAGAGVRLGRDYPLSIVDHSEAREQALQAYRRLK